MAEINGTRVNSAYDNQTVPVNPDGSPATGNTGAGGITIGGGASAPSVHVDGLGIQYLVGGDGRAHLLSDGSVYNPVPITQKTTQDNTPNVGLNNGVPQYFTVGPGGQPLWGAMAPPVNMHPGSSTSSSVNQSLSDPAALQLQRDQLAQSQTQFDATYKQTAQKNATELAQAQATQAFLSQKEAFAESQDNKRLANETRQQAFSNQLQIQNLTAQQTQLQSQRDQFNATMQQNTQKLNADAESHRQDLAAQNNRDVAQFAQNPQDYGKLAAFQLANRGWGQANTAQTSANLTSEESLQPLAAALDQRTQLANQKAPYSYTPLPALGALDLSGLNGAASPVASAQAANGGAQGIATGPATVPAGMPNAGSLADTPAGKTAANQALLANFGGVLPDFVKPFADGGLADGAYISGEAGPELNIPLGEGKALVINAEMMKKMKPADIKKLKMMADGGVFNGGSVTNLDTTDANKFRMDAFTKAIGGTPWAAGGLGGLPTSVYTSSPGFSPLVQSLLGSLNQQGKGVPIEEYQRQAGQLAPLGYNQQYGHQQQIIGRTA